MRKLFSVITLTYTNFEHLKETVFSVLAQDYSDIEYIICDDGSRDFPEEQITKWIENNKGTNLKQYKILRQEKNVGTVRNINYAYKHATGEYYVNLSCGDVFFEKQTVSKIAEYMIKKDSKMLVTSRLLYTDEFIPVGLVPHYNERARLYKMASREDQYQEFLKTRMYGMASGSVLCASKAIMDELGYFDERYTLLEDGPLLAKYLKKYKLDCYPELVSIWYEQGGVSTGGIKKLSPTLQKDTALFNQCERILQKPPSSFEKSRKKFMKARREAETKTQKLFCYLAYPANTAAFLVFKFMDRTKRIKDKRIISRAMAERGQAAVDGC